MSTIRRLTVGGLVVAAAGIPIQMAGGADYPIVPPGVAVLLASAALFAVRNRWTPLVAVLVPIFLTIGSVATPNVGDQLAEPSEFLTFTGTVIQMVAMLLGLVFGLVVTVQSIRKGPER